MYSKFLSHSPFIPWLLSPDSAMNFFITFLFTVPSAFNHWHTSQTQSPPRYTLTVHSSQRVFIDQVIAPQFTQADALFLLCQKNGKTHEVRLSITLLSLKITRKRFSEHLRHNTHLKSSSNLMSHEICDNAKFFTKNTVVAVFRGLFHVTSDLRQTMFACQQLSFTTSIDLD